MIDFACKNFKLEEVIKCGLELSKADLTVMKYIIHESDWLDNEKIAEDLKINLSTSQRAVKKLYEKEIILRRQENLAGGGYTFHYKSRSKEDISKILMEIINNWVSKVKHELSKW